MYALVPFKPFQQKQEWQMPLRTSRPFEEVNPEAEFPDPTDNLATNSIGVRWPDDCTGECLVIDRGSGQSDMPLHDKGGDWRLKVCGVEFRIMAPPWMLRRTLQEGAFNQALAQSSPSRGSSCE